jgi:tRNA A37 threonylcarbamoyladenosine dehydratase
MRVIHPTVVIGLGGFGSVIVSKLKRKLGKLQSLPIRFLTFDTMCMTVQPFNIWSIP